MKMFILATLFLTSCATVVVPGGPTVKYFCVEPVPGSNNLECLSARAIDKRTCAMLKPEPPVHGLPAYDCWKE